MKQVADFSNQLINWYLERHRPLPWRQTKDPYLIWVSEIILQQTRVKQGIDYYFRFVSRFPDIQQLADADEEDVLKIWEGLGYYSRARNMHQTARLLASRYKGEFPEEVEELIKLKGIGKYTAAAIASIAFSKLVAVVDGNVIRFLSRVFGISEPIDHANTIKSISHIANNLISHASPGEFNQAMMEFGALQCVPANPDCKACCFSSDCTALKTGKVNELPMKAKKTKPSERFFNYLVMWHIQNGSSCIYLKKRSKSDIWKHLYDFPLIETNTLLSIGQLVRHKEFKALFNGFDPEIEICQGSYRHLLTHRVIHARFFKLEISEPGLINFSEDFICTDDVSKYPLPKLINNFLAGQGLVQPQNRKS
jgi:A/G-specific adenine glycosylase